MRHRGMRNTRPNVAYFSAVKGLWIRCSLSLIVKIRGMSIILSLTVIGLGANVVQAGRVNAVGLTVDGFDQLFGFEFFEDGKRAIGEQQPFAAVAFNGGNAARSIADVCNASTFGENV